jgi:hypothetical protein
LPRSIRLGYESLGRDKLAHIKSEYEASGTAHTNTCHGYVSKSA